MGNNKIEWDRVSDFKTPDESLGFLLWQVTIKWRRMLEAALSNVDLTHPQFVILASLGWLCRDGEDVTQKEVSTLSGIDGATTSQILRGLEKKGFLTRQNSGEDQRVKHPVLTNKGKNRMKKAIGIVEEIDNNFFSQLSKNEKMAFKKDLSNLI